MLTRVDIYNRILSLPPNQQREAMALALEQFGGGSGIVRPRKGLPPREPEERRRYAGDPWKYITDVLGWSLTGQQERVLEEVETYDRVLNPSGNNLGKTWFAGLYGVYRFDAVAALPDEEAGLEEQGAKILLPGPDHKTILKTVYLKMLVHAARAEARGHMMPGYRSDKSVNWVVRPEWDVEAFAPSKKVGEEIAHTASGRHHANMIAILEEGAAIREALWTSVEGMCSGTGNKIFSNFQPSEASGPAYERSISGSWRVVNLSAFDHPNVSNRRRGSDRGFMPGAISFRTVDDWVRTRCEDRGGPAVVKAESKFRDFQYALPPALDAPEHGGRTDGVPGHPDGEVRVYRPNAKFQAQALGQYPVQSETGLFDALAWDESNERWKKGKNPRRPPTRIGVDLAWKEVTGDAICAAPVWGTHAGDLLHELANAKQDEMLLKALRLRRIRVDQIQVLPNGPGPTVADELLARWPASEFILDIGGVGTSCYDTMVRMGDVDVQGVNFGQGAPEPIGEEDWSEDMRTAMYVRAAILLRWGLVDVPPDPLLRRELFAQRLVPTTRRAKVREQDGRLIDKRVSSARLMEKKEVKKLIGHSPDRADAFVLSLTDLKAADRFTPHIY